MCRARGFFVVYRRRRSRASAFSATSLVNKRDSRRRKAQRRAPKACKLRRTPVAAATRDMERRRGRRSAPWRDAAAVAMLRRSIRVVVTLVSFASRYRAPDRRLSRFQLCLAALLAAAERCDPKVFIKKANNESRASYFYCNTDG